MRRAIFKIVHADVFAAAEETGSLPGSSDDRRDGFIHLSSAPQLIGTLERHFGDAGHLMLIAFDAEALGPDLRWESSRGGDLFPHLYAPLPLAAMLWAAPWPMTADGHHPLTEELMRKIGGAA